ncbi:MAG: winged helix-turn-helix transcriptional regulator [Gemmatimonadetes bacterium]|nr:winged helix-turn-helix transcriptional regulator [Gemmatimonadota bacterium]
MTTAAPYQLARAAALFHALSDETRLAALALLQDGERCVCELQEPLGARQSRLSFHLKVLKDAGLVRDRREGRWAYYSLDLDVLREAAGALASLGAIVPAAARPPRLPVVLTGCCA